MVQLHAGGAEDSAQGARGAALLADDLANVTGGDMEAKYGGVLVSKDFNPDRIRIIDEGPSNLSH